MKIKFQKKLTYATSILSLLAIGYSQQGAAAEQLGVGIQFRESFQATHQAPINGGTSGTGVLLSFALDNTTQVGYLAETFNTKEATTTVGTSIASSWNVSAIRIAKSVAVDNPLYLALDMGTATGTSATSSAAVADIVFGGKWTGSVSSKANSYFNAEVLYRNLNPGASFASGTTGTGSNYSGVIVVFGAGIAF